MYQRIGRGGLLDYHGALGLSAAEPSVELWMKFLSCSTMRSSCSPLDGYRETKYIIIAIDIILYLLLALK